MDIDGVGDWVDDGAELATHGQLGGRRLAGSGRERHG